MTNDYYERYLEAKIKYCYYLLGITSAILGLSIQFIEPKDSDIFSFLVFVSWGAFIISIIAGIRWQRKWIDWLILSSTASMRPHLDDEEVIKKLEEINPPELRDIIHGKLSLSGETQYISFIIGLIAIALFKLINFYS